jgi:hypothetical protein
MESYLEVVRATLACSEAMLPALQADGGGKCVKDEVNDLP